MKPHTVGDQLPLMVLPESAMRAGVLNSKKRGHAWAPGTGPEGETCKSCEHLARIRMAHVYLKCRLMRDRWTRGESTDIRARDPACRHWEARKPDKS